MRDKALTRICGECKEEIILKEYKFTIYKNVYYHLEQECFYNHFLNLKRNKLSKEELDKFINDSKDENFSKVKYLIYKDELFSWLQGHYNIVVMPSYIFTKLEEIFVGKWRGMDGKGIPPEDLLDMWNRQWNNLVGLHNYNSAKGKLIDEVQQLNYDIAVILGKSTSYYNWKSNQKTSKQEVKEFINSKKIDYENFAPKPKKDDDEQFFNDMGDKE